MLTAMVEPLLQVALRHSAPLQAAASAPAPVVHGAVDSVRMDQSPLPGGVANIFRFLFSGVPQWIQIGGVVLVDRVPDPTVPAVDDAGNCFLQRLTERLGGLEFESDDAPAELAEMRLFEAPDREAEARWAAESVRAVIAAEKMGIPGVAVTGPGFDEQARAVGMDEGVPSVQVAVYPGPFALHSDAELQENSRTIVASARFIRWPRRAGRGRRGRLSR